MITGLTGVGHLVYLAAFVPDEGESAASLGGSTALLSSAIVGARDGATRLDSKRATRVLYADCPDDVAAWATDLLRVQMPGCGRGIPRRQAWRDTRSTYVICADDQAIDPAVQQKMARRITGHSPFLGDPGLVVDLVGELLGNSEVAHREAGL